MPGAVMLKKLKLNGSRKTYWWRKWQPTPVFLPWESWGRGSLVGCRPWGHRVGHDWSDLAAAATAAAAAAWRPTRPLRTNAQKRCPFHYRGLECKSRKSRNTRSNRQIWPWSTEWSQAKAKRVLPRERTGHSKHPLPTTQEKTLHMDITRWSTLRSDWLYSLEPKMDMLSTVSKNKTVAQIMNCLL